MKNYELTVILRNKDVDSLRQKVLDILSKQKVTISNEDSWGNRKLAYEIQSEKEGFYILFNLEASPDSISKIISDFKLNPDILRYLFVLPKRKKTA
jgi:small subunit ribosomal protein S6